MRPQKYARNPRQRKAYVPQPGLCTASEEGEPDSGVKVIVGPSACTPAGLTATHSAWAVQGSRRLRRPMLTALRRPPSTEIVVEHNG
jgi:hypothetical protein